MQQKASITFVVEGIDDPLNGEESKVEHYAFPWTIKGFLDELGRDLELTFAASNNDESFTLWQLNFSLTGQQNDIQIRLTRLRSENHALVFVRFRWEIVDVDGNKVFPGSIHAFAYPYDKLSKKFVDVCKLREDVPRFLPDDNLSVFCELTVYERTVEEKITEQVKGNIPYRLNGLTEDMEKLFFTESGADLRVSSMDFEMGCHKSILSARSSTFAKLIAAVQSDDCHLHLDKFKGDVLVAVLTYLYSGSLDMYLKHTIPTDLYSVATAYDLQYLQQHLDNVNSYGLTMLKSLDVTWKIPQFKLQTLQPKVTLFCPEQNTSTLYDKRWCFKLEFDSSRDGVDISVVRNQGENYKHHVKFVFRIVHKYGRTCFEETKFLLFEADGAQGLEAFMTKDELCGLLSYEDTLVLRCSLEVLECVRCRPQKSRMKTLVEHVSINAEESILMMAQDLRRMYAREMFSNAFVYSRLGKICYHSFLANVRFDLPDSDFNAFVQSLNSHLVQPFFLFLYGGDAVKNKAIGIKQAAELRFVPNIVNKMKAFLDLYYA